LIGQGEQGIKEGHAGAVERTRSTWRTRRTRRKGRTQNKRRTGGMERTGRTERTRWRGGGQGEHYTRDRECSEERGNREDRENRE
jgi:hypothetical protein